MMVLDGLCDTNFNDMAKQVGNYMCIADEEELLKPSFYVVFLYHKISLFHSSIFS